MTLEQAARLVAIAMAHYVHAKPIDAVVLAQTWATIMPDLDDALAQRALYQHIRCSPYFPTASDILSHSTEASFPGAWEEALDHARASSTTWNVGIPVKRAYFEIGGGRAIREATPEQLEGLRRRFADALRRELFSGRVEPAAISS